MIEDINQQLAELPQSMRLVVGFSGGVDSTVLLHLLANDKQFKNRVLAVHVNHQLHKDADDWETHCHKLANTLHIPFISKRIDILKTNGESLEEEARIKRYKVFESLVSKEEALLLAHHQGDQAETLLLQLLRGAGLEGLGAMPVSVTKKHLRVIRPLLSYAKLDLLAYAKKHHLTWIEDSSNQEVRFSRNFIRHQVMPLLESHFPSTEKRLARTTEHLRETGLALNELISPHYERCVDSHHRLLVEPLLTLSSPLQKVILRQWLSHHHLRMPNTRRLNSFIRALIDAKEDKSPTLLIDKTCIKRFKGRLYIIRNTNSLTQTPKAIPWLELSSPLTLPENLGSLYLKKDTTQKAFYLPKDSKVTVRFRQGGEVIYLNNCHQKLKKLFQQWSVPPWERLSIPLLYINDELAAIPGYCISQHFDKRGVNNYHLDHISC